MDDSLSQRWKISWVRCSWRLQSSTNIILHRVTISHRPKTWQWLPTRYLIQDQEPEVKQIEFFHWGLIPSWAKDPKIGNRMINARSETLAEKPSFRNAYKRRRCLVLADGYYEWQKIPGEKTKQPVYIRLKSQKPFAFAGLWEVWKGTGMDEPLRSCTIITCPPNAVLAEIHHRMPVILPAEAYAAWLAPDEQSSEVLQPLLVPYAYEEMEAYPVSTVRQSSCE